MSWAQLTNRPNNNGSQRYTNNSRKYTNPRVRTNNNMNNYNNNNNNMPPRHSQRHNQHHHNQNNQHHNQHNQHNQHRVGIVNSKRRHNDINYVILDAGAFIGRQAVYNNFSPNVRYYMTPAVNNEIRDKQSRQFLDNFPYQIIVKRPDPQSIQFVNKFINKNPTLRSLSKVDKHVIALAHTLELEFEGTKHIEIMDNKKKKGDKANSVSGDNKNKGKPVKKSKTGRIHTQMEQMGDTGLRLAKLKKIIPFHFDDFMTLTSKQYGEKYGKPTMDMPPSPARSSVSPQKQDLKDAVNDKGNENENENKQNDEGDGNDGDKMLENEGEEPGAEKIKYNPNIKAMTECGPRLGLNEDEDALGASPISKAQKRRRRKKMAEKKKVEKTATNPSSSGLTEDKLLEFALTEDKDDEEDDEEDDDILNAIKLDEDQNINTLNTSILNTSTLNVNAPEFEMKSNGGDTEKSDVEQMIEEDHALFAETASLIETLSEHSAQQIRSMNAMSNRLDADNINNNNNNINPLPNTLPNIVQSQSLPSVLGPNGAAQAGGGGDNIPFGTMFTTGQGSVFGAAGNPQINPSMNPVQSQPTLGGMSHSPLPPLDQNVATDPVKKTINDAWNNEWLTPENFKPVPKNANKKKAKLKNISNSKNTDSSVAVITVDTVMQKCMADMGLRVLSTSNDRQYGGGRNNGQYNNNYNNNEPVDYVFRCYGCFQFEHDTTRTNCRWCSGQTFQRVAIYQDENGKHHYRYYYRDRYAHKYLEKNQLIPRGSQLVKFKGNNNNNNYNQRNNNNQRKKKKKRGYLGNNNNNYRGGGGSRW